MKASTSLTEDEYKILERKAQLSGQSISSLLRYACLKTNPKKTIRQPTVKDQYAAQMLAYLGRLSTDLRTHRAAFNAAAGHQYVAAIHRDITEMRYLCFKALGREP